MSTVLPLLPPLPLVADISSAEEEQIKRRRVKRAKVVKKPLLPIEGIRTDVNDVATTNSHLSIIPTIQGFAELLSSNPHLQDDEKTGAPVCKLNRIESTRVKRKRKQVNPEHDTTEPLSRPTKLARSEYHINQSDTNPVYDHLQEIMDRMPFPPWINVGQSDTKEAYEALITSIRETSGRILPLLDANTANELLQEAGSFTHSIDSYAKTHNFPACKFGASGKCVGQTHVVHGFAEQGQPQGAVMMSFMYKWEWVTFITTGEIPPHPRPCLGCMRYDAGRFVFCLSAVKNKRVRDPTAPSLDQFIVNGTSCWQWVKELTNEVGGYHGAYMHTVDDQEWQGYVDSFAMLSLHVLSAGKDEKTGRWYWDQTPMLFTRPEPLLSTPGQSLENFYVGAR